MCAVCASGPPGLRDHQKWLNYRSRSIGLDVPVDVELRISP